MLHLTEAINWPTFVLSIVSSGGNFRIIWFYPASKGVLL